MDKTHIARGNGSPIPVYQGGKLIHILHPVTLDDILPLIPELPRRGSEKKWWREIVRQSHMEADERINEPGKCYFIGGETGFIKIGFSASPEARLKSLQLCSPLPLNILAVARGGKWRESAYHQQFRDYRQHGEWFSRHPDILAEIDRLSPSTPGAQP